MMLPAMASLVLLHLGAPEWAGASLAIAMLTKPQALLLVARSSSSARGAPGGRAPSSAPRRAASSRRGVIFLPYALIGAIPNVWLAFGSFYARRDILRATRPTSGGSPTTCCERGIRFRDSAVGGISRPGAAHHGGQHVPGARLPESPAFRGHLVVRERWSLWRIRRAAISPVHALGAAFIVHAFFVLSVGVHEHHMMLAVPLLALAAALRPSIRRLFWAVSLIVALNMNLFYGIGMGLGWSLPRGLLLVDFSVLLSIANLAALVWHGRVLVREAADPVPQAGDDSSAARSHFARSAAAT